jgi:hypothetical protein
MKRFIVRACSVGDLSSRAGGCWSWALVSPIFSRICAVSRAILGRSSLSGATRPLSASVTAARANEVGRAMVLARSGLLERSSRLRSPRRRERTLRAGDLGKRAGQRRRITELGAAEQQLEPTA